MAVYPDGKDVTPEHVSKLLKNPNSKEAKHLAYGFSAILANPQFSKHAQKIYDQFRDDGFDAIPDIFDKYNGISETPTIIIRPEKLTLIESIEIDKVTYKKSKRAIKRYGEIPVSEIIK